MGATWKRNLVSGIRPCVTEVEVEIHAHASTFDSFGEPNIIVQVVDTTARIDPNSLPYGVGPRLG